MARVFLSHSSRDNGSAGRMKAWLGQQGFEAPFLDFDVPVQGLDMGCAGIRDATRSTCGGSDGLK
jgi:hypothetical protein